MIIDSLPESGTIVDGMKQILKSNLLTESILLPHYLFQMLNIVMVENINNNTYSLVWWWNTLIPEDHCEIETILFYIGSS